MANVLTSADYNVTKVALRRSDREIACQFCAVSAWKYPALAARRSQLLSEAELAYFEGLPVRRRQMSYLLGRVAAKTALASLIAEDDYRAIAITAGIFGQPLVRHWKAVGYDVSISHNREAAVAIAFDSGHPMGIDLETFDVSLYETLLNAIPAEEASCLPNRHAASPERLLVLWTVKEALSKVLRCGMMTPAAVLAIESLTPIGLGQYEAVFRNFAQYQARSWVCNSTVLSIVLPLSTEIEFEPFQLVNRQG